MRKTRENQAVRAFILEHVDEYPDTIAKITGEKFGLSRTAVNRYLRKLVAEGILESSGNTRARRYVERPLVDQTFEIKLSAGLPEDQIWRFRILPLMQNVKTNVVGLCEYCFTEILNNAIDHSGADRACIWYAQTHNFISMSITDFGIGIFEKIRRDFNLPDPRMALLELSKGKLTSDRKRHSGQGIFFTSRMVDRFQILSGYLHYSRSREEDDDWLIEEDNDWRIEVGEAILSEKGTHVYMRIALDTDRTTREVFDTYQGRDLSFNKTHVPIKLGKYPGENLVSRSQAKRVLARFEDFTQVMLDFDGVDDIGQAFADEIFRVFKNAHPQIEILTINTTPQIESMIAFVKAYDESNPA